MTQIMPQDELLRRAVEWILSEKREKPGRTLVDIIDEAGMRHNLSPVECARLQHLLIAMQDE